MSESEHAELPGERQAFRGESMLLPGNMVADEIGKVYVRENGDNLDIEFTVLQELSGHKAEGWQTGIAFDASASMADWYGRSLTGELPPEAIGEYKKMGLIVDRVDDGEAVWTLQPGAYEDAIEKGYLKYTENIIDPLAKEFISYLADEYDADGRTTIMYWACGDDGRDFEVVGDFSGAECEYLIINGPKKKAFGEKTYLAPTLHYFLDRFKNATQGMYVFITDGSLDDLLEVKEATTQLAKDIEAGRRNPVKCVLIGVGNEVREDQMTELDDLDTGTDVDIWDYKIATEMRSLVEIFAEVVSDEDDIVALSGMLYDDQGNLVADFTDGLPSRVHFSMPKSSAFFELEVAGRRIRQPIRVDA